MAERAVRVAVVGATGLVGETMIKVLEERDFPVSELYPLASSRSLGKTIAFRGKSYGVDDLAENRPMSALLKSNSARSSTP